MSFDARQGAFRVRRRGRGSARVTGDGLDAHWARSALERQGFELSTDDDPHPPDLEVAVARLAGRAVWQETRRGRRIGDYASLKDLVASVRGHASRV